MMSWKNEPDHTSRTFLAAGHDGYAYGYYDQQGAWSWQVVWNGWHVKSGSGCVNRAETQREADALIESIETGSIDPPWKKTKERQELEDRLSRARFSVRGTIVV